MTPWSSSRRTTMLTCRLEWTAMDPSHAARAEVELQDQLRGAKLTMPQLPGWVVHWTTWRNLSRYGAVLWAEPSPD